MENEDFGDSTLRVNYNPSASILGHEIFSQIFLSLVQQLSCYDFNLDLHNSSFLDESWQLPTILRTEMVPCDRLGLTLGFPMGFALIVEILENSCAAEIVSPFKYSNSDENYWDFNQLENEISVFNYIIP